jgi:membrane protein
MLERITFPGEPSRRTQVPGWLQELGEVLKDTAKESLEDGIPARGAALSYYVILSLGPLLILIIGVLELLVSEADVRERIVALVADRIGASAAHATATVIERAEVPDLVSVGSILTVLLLIFGATAAFANIRGSLNTIWGLGPEEPTKREIAVDLVRARARGFLMIVLTGIVITVSFALTSLVSAVEETLRIWLPYGPQFVQAMDVTLSVLFIGLLFGAVFRTLPSARLEWRSICVGAFVTSLLFVVGKVLIARVLADMTWTSYYGPGASIVAFLAWIYLSAQIFFVGAEFTQIWARRHGDLIETSTKKNRSRGGAHE